MTWNIRFDNPEDGKFSWNYRSSLVRALLESEQPQIACFQEVLKIQFNHLQKMLPGYNGFGVGRDDGKEAGEFSPIFYDTIRFRFISGTTKWLSERPSTPGSRSWGAACTRIVTKVVLYDRLWRDTLLVYNTHFDHVSPLAREKSAGMIAGDIAETGKNRLIIVAGDLNDTINSSALNLFKTGNILPALPEGTNAPDGPDYTYIGFPYAPHPGTMIDFILTGVMDGYKINESYINTMNFNGFYPSDHFPVITVFHRKE